MKTLYLLRHAKSDWGNPNLADRDRSLNQRGFKTAQALGSLFKKKALKPGLILCSPARRSRQTLHIIAEETGENYPVRYDEGLYETGADVILDILRGCPDDTNSIMLIGHNPGLETSARMLIKAGKPKALARLQEKFPTGGLACLTFDVGHWRDIAPASGWLAQFTVPKDIKSPS